MLFIDNKYTNWYYSIVNRAQTRTLPVDVYTEKHHIVPKSMGGEHRGRNNNNKNIVRLTAKEHVVCHVLLTKMTTGTDRDKMLMALTAVYDLKSGNHSGKRDYTKSARVIAKAREQAAIARRGSKRSEESKQKMREAAKNRPPFSQERKDKLSARFKGVPRPQWVVNKIRAGCKSKSS